MSNQFGHLSGRLSPPPSQPGHTPIAGSNISLQRMKEGLPDLKNDANINRFGNRMLGPMPGLTLGADEGHIERDALGKPLSPTNLLQSSKPFPGGQPGKAGSDNKEIKNSNPEKAKSDNIISGSANIESSNPSKEEALQQKLSGPPLLDGLSSLEYAIDGNLNYGFLIRKKDSLDVETVEEFQRQFHRENSDLSASGSGADKKENDSKNLLEKHLAAVEGDSKTLTLAEVSINLSQQMMVEQVEIRVANKDLVSKYFKVSGITRAPQANADYLRSEQETTKDIQISLPGHSPEENRRRQMKAKFLKLSSGFYDQQKQVIEANFQGAVCHQVNVQFELDIAKVRGLLNKCHELQMKRQEGSEDPSKNTKGSLQMGEGTGPFYATEHRKKDTDPHTGVEKLPTNTQSQFMSSYGGDINDFDNSEMDDCDNEVSNIQRNLQNKRAQQLHQNREREKAEANAQARPEDIQLEFIDDLKSKDEGMPEKMNNFISKTSSGINLQQKMRDPAPKGSEEKQILEEKRLLEGLLSDQPEKHIGRVMTTMLSSIKVIGFNVMKIPAITNLAHLMNTSFYLRKNKVFLEDALEVDMLLGTLLISSKRNTQAIEVLRNRVQSVYLHQIDVNLGRLQGKEQPIGVYNSQERHQEPSTVNENLKIQTKKLFQRSAIIELLCSESMCIKPQLNDKLLALQRMTNLCRGLQVKKLSFTEQIFNAEDEYTTMVNILPYMLKFTIQCTENNPSYNREIVMVSALRNIQFILETQGCSLDSAMIVILKSIFKNYPDKLKQEKLAKRIKELKDRSVLKHDVSTGKESVKVLPKNTLLSESQRRIGGIHGTSSANDLNFRQKQLGSFDHKDSASKRAGFNHQLNQSSARDSGEKQIKLDDSRAGPSRQVDAKKLLGEKTTLAEELNTVTWVPYRDEPTIKKEPNSGFDKIQMGLFNNLLETYISVLSSISSHILHQIFYEVIVPCLTNQPFPEDRSRSEEDDSVYIEFSSEVKIFAVKIAEKIITICQGDLIMSKELLDTLVKQQAPPSFKKQLEMSSSAEQLRNQLKNLWTSIRTKVFTNYSMKGFKQLIDWLVHKMSLLAQNCTILDGKSSASEIAMLEMSEDDLQQLCQYLEIITLISVGRRNNQEEANSLIKIKQEYCMDLFLLLNPLLFWLDFSVEREERLGLFKQVYQTLKDVLDNIPPKKVDIDILQIISPILQRTSEYLKHYSPTQPMLKFLDITLTDIRAGNFANNHDLQFFFLDMLSNLLNYMTYCLHEEIFPVFDKLLSLSQEVMTNSVLEKAIHSLIDKYTMKNKAHKQSIQLLVKHLMDIDKKGHVVTEEEGYMDICDQEIDIVDANNPRPRVRDPRRKNFFEIMLDFCFFKNSDDPSKIAAEVLKNNSSKPNDKVLRENPSLQYRSPYDLHENYTDKLQFFIDALNLMGEKHVNQFSRLLYHPKFKQTLFGLLGSGEISLRMKCHEILEIIGNYYIQFCSSKTLYELAIPQDLTDRSRGRNGNNQYEMMEVDFISTDRLYIAQLMVQCVKKSFDINQGNDSYLQFNSLILLDYLFQHLLPVQSFQNEQLKQRQILESQIIQFKRYQDQAHHNREMVNVLNESQIEEGSSGGEGTSSRAVAVAAAAARHGSMRSGREDFPLFSGQNERPVDVSKVQRSMNPTFLGNLEDALDIESMAINELTPELEVTDPKYAAMRMKLVFKLQPYIMEALNSPWSNIRSICYGLICSMLKIDIRDCCKYLPFRAEAEQTDSQQQIEIRMGSVKDSSHFDRLTSELNEKDLEMMEANKFYQSLRSFVIPMMVSLLSSKESESKAGGLNILGSICGLSYDFSKIKISRNMEFFKRNSEFISLPIWQLVFDLQDDWDITIKEASIVLIQLCAPRDAIKYFNKCKIDKENVRFQKMSTKMTKAHQNSMSNLSSARQNSFYNHIGSRASLQGLKKCEGGDIDYKKVDFGYKNKAIPAYNEFGKLDMASFLNDDQDMMNLDERPEDGSSRKTSSEKQQEEDTFRSSKYDPILGANKQLALDLGKIYQTKDELKDNLQASGGFDFDGIYQPSSRSQNSLGSKLITKQVLQQSQQQNVHLKQAILGSGPSQHLFDFFVDSYSDEQIQEIISIFRNDFKPPKSLWIEKAAESSIFSGHDFYQDIFPQAIEQFNQDQIRRQEDSQKLSEQAVSNGSASPTGSPGLPPDRRGNTQSDASPMIQSGSFNPSQDFQAQKDKSENESGEGQVEASKASNPSEEASKAEKPSPKQKEEAAPAEEKPSITEIEEVSTKIDDINLIDDLDFTDIPIYKTDVYRGQAEPGDIGVQGGDDSQEFVMDDKQHKAIMEGDHQDLLDDYIDMPNLGGIPQTNNNDVVILDQSSPEKPVTDKYKLKSDDLQIIESSNEVSSNSITEAANAMHDHHSSHPATDSESKKDSVHIKGSQESTDALKLELDKYEALNQERIKMIEREQQKVAVLSEPMGTNNGASQKEIDAHSIVIDHAKFSGAKTQVFDMSKYKSEIDSEIKRLDGLNMVIKDEFEHSNDQLAQIGEIQKAYNTGLNKSSNSQPDFNRKPKGAKIKKIIPSKTKNDSGSFIAPAESSSKHETSRTNPPPLSSLPTANMPTGMKSHRVQVAGSLVSAQEQPKKLVLKKNQQQIKTNTDDYMMMLQILNTSGLNTTQNAQLKNDLLKVGGGALSKSNQGGTQKGQHSQEGLKQKTKRPPTHTLSQSSKSTGAQKKTLSSSPVRQLYNQDVGRPQPQMKQASTIKTAKTVRMAPQTVNQANNNLKMQSSNQQANKKMMDTPKDWKKLIKTIEKFSKNSNLKDVPGLPNQPQIMQQYGNMTLAGSDPHTPKEAFTNITEQLHKMMQNTTSTSKSRKSGSKQKRGDSAKITVGAKIKSKQQSTGIHNFYPDPNSSQPPFTGAVSETLNQQLRNSGINLSQFNELLGKSGHSQIPVGAGDVGGSRGRSAGRGIFDLTPDSNSNSNHRMNAMRNEFSKSQKSYGSKNQTSHSPNRHSQKSSKEYPLGLTNLNIKTNMQNILSSHRDGSSVDSHSRSRGALKGVRSTSGHKAKRKVNLSGDQKSSGGGMLIDKGKMNKSHNQGKKNSLHLHQPPMLNNLFMNNSQTQKIDLKEINQQLFASNPQKGSVSTQHKNNNNVQLHYTKGSQTLHSQREKRERSTGSAKNSTSRGGLTTKSGGGNYPAEEQRIRSEQFSLANHNPKQQKSKYNSLMLSHKYQAASSGVTHARKNSAVDDPKKKIRLSSPRNLDEPKTKHVNSSRGSKPHISGQPFLKNPHEGKAAPKSARGGPAEFASMPLGTKNIPQINTTGGGHNNRKQSYNHK